MGKKTVVVFQQFSSLSAKHYSSISTICVRGQSAGAGSTASGKWQWENHDVSVNQI